MRKAVPVVVLVILGVLLVSAASLSACVPQPIIWLQPKASGPPGTEVAVSGSSFNADPIEVRWNALDGPQLGGAEGPEFSTSFLVPEAPPGLYVVVALSRDRNGTVSSRATSSFEVPDQGEGASGSAVDDQRAAPAPIRHDDRVSTSQVAGVVVAALSLATVGGLVGAFVISRRTAAAEGTSHRTASG